jgi:uncharacterized integral membrane protein (TIGR00698 family)
MNPVGTVTLTPPATLSPAIPWRGLLPGLSAALAIAVAAEVAGRNVPVVGAPVIALLAGIGVSVAVPVRARLRPGLAFAGKRVLQGSIILLGLGLSVTEVARTGLASLPVLAGTLMAALVAAALAGRALGLPSDLKTLVGVGTAICGASAIAATDSVIGADEADVGYAMTTIFVFNIVAAVAYPSIGHALGLSQHAFGLWAGTAINDTSSVVAASTVYGHAAATYGIVVKLTRSLAIVPVCLALAAWRGRRPGHATAARPADAKAGLGRVVPLFIAGFGAAVCVNSAGAIPAAWHPALSDLAGLMVATALAGIGLSTNIGAIRRAGPRPMVLGALLWATVGLTSLALQGLTGSL